MKFKIRPILFSAAIYLSSLALNQVAYTFNSFWAGARALEYSILNRQYWELVKYHEEIYRESKTHWQFVPGSFLWRLPERPELKPLEFDEPNEEQYKKPMVANGLEKISQNINCF